MCTFLVDTLMLSLSRTHCSLPAVFFQQLCHSGIVCLLLASCDALGIVLLTVVAQGHLFAALRRVKLIPEDVAISSLKYSRCGRTDKGVSALGQVS